MKLDMNIMRELAGIPYNPDRVLTEEKDSSGSTIKALRDTDYRDKEAFFKMVQLLKGLAVASEKDEQAKKYLSAVSDALTSAAKKVLGEGLEDNTDVIVEELGSGVKRGISNAVSFLKYASDEVDKDKGRNVVLGISDALSALAIVLKRVDRDYSGMKNVSDLLRKASRDITVASGKV